MIYYFPLHIQEFLRAAQGAFTVEKGHQVPVAKNRSPKGLSDFRPVALTSLGMKAFENLIKSELVRAVEDSSDPLQFAHRSRKGVDDAVIKHICSF